MYLCLEAVLPHLVATARTTTISVDTMSEDDVSEASTLYPADTGESEEDCKTFCDVTLLSEEILATSKNEETESVCADAFEAEESSADESLYPDSDVSDYDPGSRRNALLASVRTIAHDLTWKDESNGWYRIALPEDSTRSRLRRVGLEKPAKTLSLAVGPAQADRTNFRQFKKNSIPERATRNYTMLVFVQPSEEVILRRRALLNRKMELVKKKKLIKKKLDEAKLLQTIARERVKTEHRQKKKLLTDRLEECRNDVQSKLALYRKIYRFVYRPIGPRLPCVTFNEQVAVATYQVGYYPSDFWITKDEQKYNEDYVKWENDLAAGRMYMVCAEAARIGRGFQLNKTLKLLSEIPLPEVVNPRDRLNKSDFRYFAANLFELNVQSHQIYNCDLYGNERRRLARFHMCYEFYFFIVVVWIAGFLMFLQQTRASYILYHTLLRLKSGKPLSQLRHEAEIEAAAASAAEGRALVRAAALPVIDCSTESSTFQGLCISIDDDDDAAIHDDDYATATAAATPEGQALLHTIDYSTESSTFKGLCITIDDDHDAAIHDHDDAAKETVADETVNAAAEEITESSTTTNDNKVAAEGDQTESTPNPDDISKFAVENEAANIAAAKKKAHADKLRAKALEYQAYADEAAGWYNAVRISKTSSETGDAEEEIRTGPVWMPAQEDRTGPVSAQRNHPARKAFRIHLKMPVKTPVRGPVCVPAQDDRTGPVSAKRIQPARKARTIEPQMPVKDTVRKPQKTPLPTSKEAMEMPGQTPVGKPQRTPLQRGRQKLPPPVLSIAAPVIAPVKKTTSQTGRQKKNLEEAPPSGSSKAAPVNRNKALQTGRQKKNVDEAPPSAPLKRKYVRRAVSEEPSVKRLKTESPPTQSRGRQASAKQLTNLKGFPLFKPSRIVKSEYWEHCWLVAPRKDVGTKKSEWNTSDAQSFYCMLCKFEGTFSPGNSNQVSRHVASDIHKQAVTSFTNKSNCN